jgi:hypothetical protein
MSDIVERLHSPEFADVAEKYLMLEAADEIARLRVLVKDLADDLECALNNHYCIISGKVHPAEQRRYERDMQNVHEARRALEGK